MFYSNILGQTFKAQISSLIVISYHVNASWFLVTKAQNKVIQGCIHARQEAVNHHIGAADSLSVHPVFYQLIKGHVKWFEESASRKIYLN